jgi:WD40 repeat protein
VAWGGGGLLASAGGDDAVRVWRAPPAGAAPADVDAVHMPLVATARPDPPCEVNCVAWRPGGGEAGERVLAAACDDGRVRVWRVAGVQEGEAG